MNELKEIIKERIADAIYAKNKSSHKEYWEGVIEAYQTIILIIETEQNERNT